MSKRARWVCNLLSQRLRDVWEHGFLPALFVLQGFMFFWGGTHVRVYNLRFGVALRVGIST